VATHSKDFVILTCVGLTQYRSVTDRQTDGRTDRRTPRRWLRHAKHYMLSRIKMKTEMWRVGSTNSWQ